MEEYEVHCESVPEARQFRFTCINDAMTEADRLCKKHRIDVRVVRVVGVYVPESRWIQK